MSFYFTSFQVKTKATADTWEIKQQEATYHFYLGDCLAWLNNRFSLASKNYKNHEGFVSWIIRTEKDFYSGLFQLNNGNFLEKVLDSDTIKDKLEDFRNDTD